MLWQIIILNRLVRRQELVAALCQIFHLQEHQVLILKGGAMMDEILGPLLEGILVVCEIFQAQHVEFFLRIDISLREEYLFPEDHIPVFSELCRILQCRLLVEDNTTIEASSSPFAFLLLDGTEQIQHIRVFEANEYDIAEPIELE